MCTNNYKRNHPLSAPLAKFWLFHSLHFLHLSGSMRGKGGGERPWLKLFWNPSSCEPTSSLLLLESLKPVTVLPIDQNLSRIIQQGTNYVFTCKIRARILAVNSYRRWLLSPYSHIVRHIFCNCTNVFFRELCKKGLIFFPGTGNSKTICQGLATLAPYKNEGIHAGKHRDALPTLRLHHQQQLQVRV